MLKKIIFFSMIQYIKYCESYYNKNGLDEDESFFIKPIKNRVIPIFLFCLGLFFSISYFFDNLDIFYYLFVLLPVFFVFLYVLFTENLISYEKQDSFYDEAFFIAFRTIKNKELKNKMILSYIDASNFKNVYKWYSKELETHKEGGMIYFNLGKGRIEMMRVRDYFKFKGKISRFKEEGIEVNKNTVRLLSDYEVLNSIRMKKKKLIMQEKEIMAKIFANKESQTKFMEDYSQDLLKNKVKYNISNKELKEFNLDIENI